MTRHKRSPLPPLIPQHPVCPIDNVVTVWDDMIWRCPECRGRWDSDAYDAEGQADPERAQCPAEVQPYIADAERLKHIATYRYRCIRDEGHAVDGPGDVHVGAEVDDRDNSGEPYEWAEGEHPRLDLVAAQVPGQLALTDDPTPAAVRQAVADHGHAMAYDPTEAATELQRWRCADVQCGRVVLIRPNGTFYGSALDEPCVAAQLADAKPEPDQVAPTHCPTCGAAIASYAAEPDGTCTATCPECGDEWSGFTSMPA